MNKTSTGIIAGLLFGVIDILTMIPIPMQDKPIAMLGAFINRFAIGFFIATTDLPVVPWIKGLVIGLILSLPDAIITKAYAPILGIGIIGGIIISILVEKTRIKK